MSIYKKRTQILSNVRDPRYIHKESDGLTIMTAQYALPWNNITSVPLCEAVVRKVEKAVKAFPSAHVEFNFNREHPAFIFNVNSVAKCSSDDAYDAKLGRKAAKARNIAQACVIARTIVNAAREGLDEELYGTNIVLQQWFNSSKRKLREL